MMSCGFKRKLILVQGIVKVIILLSAVFTNSVFSAEWKTEPNVLFNAQYNDNVRMRAEQNNPEDSTGFTLVPRVKFLGEEQNLWDVSIDASGKITRLQDIEDAESESVFFSFSGGRKTELTEWRLNTSYERNSNFDTDYDKELSVAGLLDDRTDQTTATVVPSVSWTVSEVSQISLSLNSTRVSYDEITSQSFLDYDYDSAQISAFWRVAQSHQLGFSTSYSEYDSPDANFSWSNTEFSLDYSYTISQSSNINFSVGGRSLESLAEDATVACIANGVTVPIGSFPNDGTCPATIAGFPTTSVFDDVEGEDTGTVTNISYTSQSETSSHSLSGARTVIPSSFGSAQEQRKLSYSFSRQQTERFSIGLILDATETETLSGINSTNDRTRYRVEPKIDYKLNKNWNLNFSYRYIEQNITNSNEDSVSNSVFLNLFLRWPRLATTY